MAHVFGQPACNGEGQWRIFLRRFDRRLFADVSRLIYGIIYQFYAEAAGRPLLTGMVIAHQTFGDMLRWNPHFHAGCRAEQETVGFRPAMPKALRRFFRHDRHLFADVSRLIYHIVREFYHEAAGRPLLTGMVIAHQTFGDQLRFNPHFHAGCMAE